MKRIALALLWLVAAPAAAHELRPAYLELHEEEAGVFRVLWKTPMRGDLRLALAPSFSGRTETLGAVSSRRAGDAAVQTWRLRAVDPLPGQSVRIDGLEATMTDALVRIEFADGSTWMQRLKPARPASEIPARESALAVLGLYGRLGVEHILTGFDHLLFVLGLIILTHGGWSLLKAVSAFTLSHSVTLGAATLGFVHVPSRPVEAIIALSIVFVAVEIVRDHRGQTGLAARAPWVVAFAFGLLHGLGFAGGLSEIGLPQTHIPHALLSFSFGVEVGHVLFVAAVLGLIAAAQRLRPSLPRWATLVPAYAIGGVATFWLIERVAAF